MSSSLVHAPLASLPRDYPSPLSPLPRARVNGVVRSSRPAPSRQEPKPGSSRPVCAACSRSSLGAPLQRRVAPDRLNDGVLLGGRHRSGGRLRLSLDRDIEELDEWDGLHDDLASLSSSIGGGGARSQQIPDAPSLFVLKADGPGWLVTRVFGHSEPCWRLCLLGYLFFVILAVFHPACFL
jgi:hypothetical protein